MANPRERVLFLTRPMTGDEVTEKIFKYYNYNGLDAHDDISRLERATTNRQRFRNSAPMWLGMTAVSAYNVTRTGVLSKSGRTVAVAGLVLGSFGSYVALSTKV